MKESMQMDFPYNMLQYCFTIFGKCLRAAQINRNDTILKKSKIKLE